MPRHTRITPGLWHAETAPCGSRVGIVADGVAPVCMLGYKEALNPHDVRLIEAAPDLLAACAAALRHLEQPAEHPPCADHLREALSRATGFQW